MSFLKGRRRETGKSVTERCVMMDRKDGEKRDLKVEEGTMGQGGLQPLQTGKGKETNCPLEPPGVSQPCRHIIFKTSDLQNCKIIDLCFL